MTAPVPDPSPSPDGSVITSAWNAARSMPRWGWVAVALGGGLVAYYLIWKPAPTSDNTNSAPVEQGSTWREDAAALLASRGYSNDDIQSALTHFFDGGALSTQDSALITAASGAIGPPDNTVGPPDYQTSNPVTNPGPGAPYGGGASPGYGYTGGIGNQTTTNPVDDSGTDAAPGTWSIASMGYGWTSTLRGIAQNFYGSAEYASSLLAANAGKVPNVWEQIPAGTLVTVPRTRPA